ncbi:flagellar filament capping protein FliD [Paenibacillus tritici]|uniref:Flagellar hook-associated protein 2 n=1 Tax=Paenibacillus tritici TaxID=1873425 RepID=A0ABX2DRA2_9BACL|nr:flagellar filament capping protein FliD [Paenibacillus tritici]NQX47199.1 flagellar filament capping protein FliD [Paenibacillus tritici]
MTLRISGLASGIDVDSIVKQMMTAKRVPLDKLNQQKEILQWQRNNYREVNSKLVDYKNNKLAKFDNSAQMNSQKATVSGNTTALKAEATADANGTSMEVTVTQLAKAAAKETAGMVVSKDGKRITSNSTLEDLRVFNNVTASPDGKYSITINGKTTIKLDSTTSIADAITSINKIDGANVKAKFDEVTGKFSITSTVFSSVSKVELGSGDNFLQLFGSGAVTSTPYQVAKINVKANGSTTGTDLEFPSNILKLNGVQFTLLAESTTSATVTTETDYTTTLSTITSFVDSYNELIANFNARVNEERYPDFTPLSDEQKKEMKESEIEAWETKAKSGMLKNDEILKSTLLSMRSEITKKLGDLSAIGITSGEYHENGKLYINQEKLKEALQNEPQRVTSIFQGSNSGTDGLYDKLTSSVSTAIEKLSTKAGTSKYSVDLTTAFKSDSTMGKRLSDYNTRIRALQDRLENMENNYYKKFTAMETAMNKYNSQSSSLSSYFS